MVVENIPVKRLGRTKLDAMKGIPSKSTVKSNSRSKSPVKRMSRSKSPVKRNSISKSPVKRTSKVKSPTKRISRSKSPVKSPKKVTWENTIPINVGRPKKPLKKSPTTRQIKEFLNKEHKFSLLESPKRISYFLKTN